MDAFCSFSPGHGPWAKHVNDTNKLQVALVPPHLLPICFRTSWRWIPQLRNVSPPLTPKNNQFSQQKIKNSPNATNHVQKKNKETKKITPTHGANNKQPQQGSNTGTPLEVVSRRATRKVVRLRSNAQRAPGVKVTVTFSRFFDVWGVGLRVPRSPNHDWISRPGS